jgi:hypothetical protein
MALLESTSLQVLNHKYPSSGMPPRQVAYGVGR